MAEEKKGKEENKKGVRTRRSSAAKRALQSERRRLHNRQASSKINTALKKFKDLAAVSETKEAAKGQLKVVYSLLDKAVKTNLFKLNKASRLKSRLCKHV